MPTDLELGIVMVKPYGEYNPATPYPFLALVDAPAASYVSRIYNNTQPLDNATAWQIIARKGGAGAPFTYADFTPTQLANLQAVSYKLQSLEVLTYAGLPVGLTVGDANKAYTVQSDINSKQAIYIWDGGAFPANGNGLIVKGDGGGGSAKEWVAGTYKSEDSVTRLGSIYRVKKGVATTTQTPSPSATDWENPLSIYKNQNIISQGESNAFSVTNFYISEAGVDTATANYSRTPKIVLLAGQSITVTTFRENTVPVFAIYSADGATWKECLFSTGDPSTVISRTYTATSDCQVITQIKNTNISVGNYQVFTKFYSTPADLAGLNVVKPYFNVLKGIFIDPGPGTFDNTYTEYATSSRMPTYGITKVSISGAYLVDIAVWDAAGVFVSSGIFFNFSSFKNITDVGGTFVVNVKRIDNAPLTAADAIAIKAALSFEGLLPKVNEKNLINVKDSVSQKGDVLVLEESDGVIATSMNYMLKDETVSGTRYLRFSNDLGKTWESITNTIGDISFVHFFSNGKVLFTSGYKAYTFRTLSAITESTVLKYDGTPLGATEVNQFYVITAYRNEVNIIDGKEVLVWGDYANAGTYSARVWYSDDFGATVKCCIDFPTTPINGVVKNTRHLHGVTYHKSANKFIIWCGDLGDECQIILGQYDPRSKTWTFDRVGMGQDYKLGDIRVVGEFVYFTTDYTTGTNTGLIRCTIDQLGDFNNFQWVWKTNTRPAGSGVLSLSWDGNGNALITPDYAEPGFVYYAKNGIDFKKIKLNKVTGLFCITDANYKGDIYAKAGSYPFPHILSGMFNLTKSMRNSGFSDFMLQNNITGKVSEGNVIGGDGIGNFIPVASSMWSGENTLLLDANKTISINPKLKEAVMEVKQDATGSRTLTVNSQLLDINTAANSYTLVGYVITAGRVQFMTNKNLTTTTI